MGCKICGKNAFFERLCTPCFLRNIESRVRKELRLTKAVEKNKVLLIKDDLSRYFISSIISMPIKVVKSGRHDKKVLPWTLDDEIEDFLERTFKGRQPKREDKNIIKLFRTVRYKELELFAKLKKIKLEKRKPTKLGKLLDSLENQHLETKFSLLKSVEEIKNLPYK